MAETYLNLLNSAAEVSAKVYEQIDQSMTNRLNIEAQAGKFQVDAMQKAAQFAETQRVNDEQIMNMRAGNYMQAQKLEVEKMLMPIKMETANLQLESQRLAFQRAKEQEGKNHFNSLTSIYDNQIGFALLETESKEMAQEYLGYKARVSDYIAKGGKFDPISFEQSLKEIRSKYSATRPSSIEQIEYDPQTSYLLGQVSPKLQAEYDKRHPLVQGSRNSMATAFYDMEDKDVGKFAQYRKLYTDEEIGLLSVGRDTMQNNNKRIENWNKHLDSLGSAKARAMADPSTDPKAIVGYDTQIETYQGYIREATDQNAQLYKDAASGKYGTRAPVKQEIKKDPGVGGSTPPQKPSTGVAGVTPVTNVDMDYVGNQRWEGVNKAFDVARETFTDPVTKEVTKTPIQATEFSEVDLTWYQQKGTGDYPTLASRDRLREAVEKGVDIKVGNGSANNVATRAKIDKLLSTLDREVEIPVSEVLEGILIEAGAYRFGGPLTTAGDDYEYFGKENTASAVPVMIFGPKSDSVMRNRSTIRNSEYIFSALNKIKNPTQRNEALKEIYSALAAASLANGLTDKAK